MNRMLARLFPKYLRRTIKLDMSIRDWREFTGDGAQVGTSPIPEHPMLQPQSSTIVAVAPVS
jgi:hypothetical protein